MIIGLTLFYGQFIANGIYDNFIRGIPELVETTSAFSIIIVTSGVIILATGKKLSLTRNNVQI